MAYIPKFDVRRWVAFHRLKHQKTSRWARSAERFSSTVPIGSMYAMVSHKSHQYTPFMLACIPAPWIRHGVLNKSHILAMTKSLGISPILKPDESEVVLLRLCSRVRSGNHQCLADLSDLGFANQINFFINVWYKCVKHDLNMFKICLSTCIIYILQLGFSIGWYLYQDCLPSITESRRRTCRWRLHEHGSNRCFPRLVPGTKNLPGLLKPWLVLFGTKFAL